MAFEYGSSKRKVAQSVLIKHPLMLIISSVLTFCSGFGLAYGEPHIVGLKYWFTGGMLKSKDDSLVTSFGILILTCTIVSTMTMSSLNERQPLTSQIFLGSIIAGIFVPVVTAWTFGGGYLTKLYLLDESGCLSIHFVTSICAICGCFYMEPRLCRFTSKDQ